MSSPLHDRARPLDVAVLALACLFALVAALVATGAFSGIDQWAVDHLMPWTGPGDTRAPNSLVNSAFTVPHPRGDTQTVAGDLIAYFVSLPAYAGPAVAFVAACAVLLWRRGRLRAAAGWIVAFLIGNGLELLVKHLIERPELVRASAGTISRLGAFDSSFPSGHAVRAVLLAWMLAAVFPRLRWAFALWAVAVLCVIELDASHVPSDILGGTFLATATALAARRAELDPVPWPKTAHEQGGDGTVR